MRKNMLKRLTALLTALLMTALLPLPLVSAEGAEPGEYHATLKLFYDPTATGKHWIETDTCALTLVVKSEESAAELLDLAKCSVVIPTVGAKAEKAASALNNEGK